MTHYDFDLCDFDKCPKSEHCMRYQSYKRAKNGDLYYVTHGCLNYMLFKPINEL